MMESDCRLDESLIEQSEVSLLVPPHLLPHLMGLKIAAGVEKKYSLVEPVRHRFPARNCLNLHATAPILPVRQTDQSTELTGLAQGKSDKVRQGGTLLLHNPHGSVSFL